jgi:hypothetical protein
VSPEYSADQVRKNVVTHQTEVLQFRMNFGRIRQEGGRLSEKDSKIGMCVIVHAGVGRRQQDTGYRMVQKEGVVSRTRGCNEADTRPKSTNDHPSTITINIPQQQYNRRSHYLLRQPLPSHSLPKIPFNFPLNSLFLPRGPFTKRKCSLRLWFTCEPRLARSLRQ